jgi:hypothetical protein
MLVNVLGNPVDIFLDNNGAPLQGGSIYIGQPNTDPTNPANQITVYQDQALTTSLSQPVKTTNGQPWLNGSQIPVYMGLGVQTYSIAVLNAGGVVVLSIPSVAPFSLGGSAAGNMVVKEFISDILPNPQGLPTFTAGVTTQLPLGSNFGSGANLWVDFDGTPQHYPDDFSLNSTTLNFSNPIPVGVQKVYTKGGITTPVLAPGASTVTDATVASNAGIQSSKLSYNQGSAGAVTRTVQARLQERVSVKDFGATGNGTTDDTAAIQAAITAIGNAGGGRIYFPTGTYLVSWTIVLAANVMLEGDDKFTSTITVPNNAGGFNGYNPNAVFMLNANNCGITRLGMNGNIANNASQSFGAISNTLAVSNVFVTDCYIHDFIYNGIILNPATGVISGFNISENILQNIGWGGITAYCSTNGRINENQVISCGATGILTGYNSNTSNFNVAQNITIDGNYVTKATPPTHIVGSAAENGFMIAVGAGDSYITVSNNICYDNRNAVQDGIGLGQDGTRLNEGLVFDSNVVVYAGLYGIDVSSNHIVSSNYIRYSAQQGIKLGTDAGGNLADATVVDNIIDSCNLAGTGSNQGIWVNATLTVGIPTALYENIKINGNRVMDFNATPHTVYGLGIGFQTGLTYRNNEFNNNDFTQLSGLNGSAVTWSGPITPFVGWSYKGNKHPNSLPVISGTTPTVLGLDAASISQSAATNLSALNGVFNGQEITFQMADGNTTWVAGGNILTHGGSPQAAASNSIWKLFNYSNGCYLNQFFTP